MLNESSVNDLYHSTKSAFPYTKFRENSIDPIRITQLSWTPYVGLKTLFVKGLAENAGRHYNTIVLFKDVTYGSGVPVVVNGVNYLIEQLSAENNEIAVRCDCPDFSWRGVYANHLDGSLFGRNRKKYESKGILPPVNPTNAPMLCKHLMKTLLSLRDAGILI